MQFPEVVTSTHGWPRRYSALTHTSLPSQIAKTLPGPGLGLTQAIKLNGDSEQEEAKMLLAPHSRDLDRQPVEALPLPGEGRSGTWDWGALFQAPGGSTPSGPHSPSRSLVSALCRPGSHPCPALGACQLRHLPLRSWLQPRTHIHPAISRVGPAGLVIKGPALGSKPLTTALSHGSGDMSRDRPTSASCRERLLCTLSVRTRPHLSQCHHIQQCVSFRAYVPWGKRVKWSPM